jgi:aconitase B
MDEHQLTEEGIYNVFGVSGARTEMPGCSLVHGQSGSGCTELNGCVDIDA